MDGMGGRTAAGPPVRQRRWPPLLLTLVACVLIVPCGLHEAAAEGPVVGGAATTLLPPRAAEVPRRLGRPPPPYNALDYKYFRSYLFDNSTVRRWVGGGSGRDRAPHPGWGAAGRGAAWLGWGTSGAGRPPRTRPGTVTWVPPRSS